MADHISFALPKFRTKETFLKELNSNDGSLLYHKYKRDGIVFSTIVFSNDDIADESIIDLAGKWEPIVAAQVLNKETATLKKLNEKIEVIKNEIEELKDSTDSFSDFYKDIRKRVIAEKSKTKACHFCGKRHKTDSDNYMELPYNGCLNCGKDEYLFRASDFTKLKSIKTKITKLTLELNSLKDKVKENIKKSLKARNWHWFISAGTKSVAEDLRGYDSDY